MLRIWALITRQKGHGLMFRVKTLFLFSFLICSTNAAQAAITMNFIPSSIGNQIGGDTGTFDVAIGANAGEPGGNFYSFTLTSNNSDILINGMTSITINETNPYTVPETVTINYSIDNGAVNESALITGVFTTQSISGLQLGESFGNTLTISVVPEPTTAFLGVALVGAIIRRRRK